MSSRSSSPSPPLSTKVAGPKTAPQSVPQKGRISTSSDAAHSIATKSHLIDAMVQKTGFSRIRAEQLVNSILQGIADALERGERVEIRGFGSYAVRDRGPKKSRNPQTGEAVHVGPKRFPWFKPGKEFRDAMMNAMEAAEAKPAKVLAPPSVKVASVKSASVKSNKNPSSSGTIASSPDQKTPLSSAASSAGAVTSAGSISSAKGASTRATSSGQVSASRLKNSRP